MLCQTSINWNQSVILFNSEKVGFDIRRSTFPWPHKMLLNLCFVSGTIVRLEIAAKKTVADIQPKLISRFPELNPVTLKLIALSSILPDALQLYNAINFCLTSENPIFFCSETL
jgi:hypothetical protein